MPVNFQQALDLFAAGRFPEAAAVCRGILTIEPKHSQALHMLALVLADEGKVAEGLACIEQAQRLDPQNPAVQVAHGRLLLYAGRYSEAVETLRQARARDPGNVEAHHYLAIALQQVGRLEEAEQAARTALELQPDMPELLDNLGSIRVRRGDPEGARACFEQALAIMPDHRGALGNLALWEERSNRLVEAMQLAERGLANHPQDVTLRLVLGRCQRRRSEYVAARATLESLRGVGTAALHKDVEYELALCADALGETDATIAYASRANQIARELRPQAEQEAREFAELLENLRKRFTPEWVASWSVLPAESDSVPPVFLMGFARSGTTLLDTMLGAHPAFTVLEELLTGWAMIESLSRMPGGYPGALAGLTAASRAALEQDYRRAVAAAGADHSRRVLDKSPFLTAHAGLIQRVFPHAPILFMVRHPCDVVLSCFLTNFELNSGTTHFTALDSTVTLYCSMMSLWRVYRDLLPLKYRMVRYEDLIARPEQELRGLLAFLDMPWSPSVLDHSAHAATRGRINSSSYAQVVRPIYQGAHGRWRRYQKYLDPYLPKLRPWCELFGYDC